MAPAVTRTVQGTQRAARTIASHDPVFLKFSKDFAYHLFVKRGMCDNTSRMLDDPEGELRKILFKLT